MQRVRVAVPEPDFTDLADTPGSLGTAGQVPAVNADGDALVFVDQTGGGSGVQSDWDEGDTSSEAYIQNKPTIPAVQTGTEDRQMLRWNATDARWEPAHIVTGETMTGSGTAAHPLNVTINEVTEQLQETQVHFTSDFPITETTKGATVGQVYDTGPFSTEITRVRIYLAGAGTNGTTGRARIYRLVNNSNEIAELLANSAEITHHGSQEHYFNFPNGVEIPTDSRIAIVFSRTDESNDSATFMRYGSEDADSPHVSYDDTTVDFNRRGWVEYESREPQVGNGTRTHDTDGNADVYGNIKIQYRRTFNHGHLLGTGHVDVDHLDDDVTARLLAASPGDNQVMRYDSSSSSWQAEDLPSTTGLTQTAGDARYVRLATASTMTAKLTVDDDSGTALTIDAQGGNSSMPVLEIITGQHSGRRKAFQAKMNTGGGTIGWAWASFEYDVGGTNKPGFALGLGGVGQSRDTNLYREGTNHLKTDDTFTASELRIDGTLATTQSNLGIPSNSDIDGRVATWARANSPSGTVPNARLGTNVVKPSTSGTAIRTIRQISQADYDALATPDANTLYVIT